MKEKQGEYITDFGESMEVKRDGEVVLTVPRYGVWVHDHAKGKPQVAECSDDLGYLMQKYGVSRDRVVAVPSARISPDDPPPGPSI